MAHEFFGYARARLTPLARRIDTALHYRTTSACSGRPQTLAQVAAQVPLCDVADLTAWREGRGEPEDYQMAALAHVLGITEHWLRTGDRTGPIIAKKRRGRD